MKLYIYLFILLNSLNAFPNTDKKEHNIIISIDGNIPVGQISKISIEYINDDNVKSSIAIDYYPGKLFINEQDEQIISNLKNKELTLCFNYNQLCKDKIKTKRFEIDLSYSIICNPYLVLNVYTMEKNKQIFYPLKNKDYTFEYDLPNQASLRRVTKKDRNCKC